MMTNEMRILTVRQPWAHAIIHLGKDVENRVRNIAGSYRGPVAIHAAKHAGASFHLRHAQLWPISDHHVRGAIIGVIDLRATHHAEFCADEPEPCSPWAEPDEMWHLELTNPRPLAEPIPYRGALGLRRLDEETTAAVWSQIGERR